MQLRVSRTAGAVALVLLPLAGCGGGDDSTVASPSRSASSTPSATPSPTPTGLAKADYVAQSEAACAKANADLDAVPEPTTPAELEPAFGKILTIADTTTTQLEQLAAAQPDKAELDRIFLAPLRGQVSGLRTYLPQLTAAAQKGEAAVEALGQPDLPKADLAAMTAYGFKECVTTADTEGGEGA